MDVMWLKTGGSCSILMIYAVEKHFMFDKTEGQTRSFHRRIEVKVRRYICSKSAYSSPNPDISFEYRFRFRFVDGFFS